MDKREIICKKLKEYNGNFASDIVQKELKDMLNVVGANIDYFDLDNVKYSEAPYDPEMVLSSDNKLLRIYRYGMNRYCIDYVDDKKEVKTFSVIHNDKIFARVIGNVIHTEKGDYIYHLCSHRNYYGKSFINDGRFDITYSAIQHTPGRSSIKYYSSEALKSGVDEYELIEYVIPSNYSIDDLVKLMRMFETHPKEVSNFIKQSKQNDRVFKKINYISYDSRRDYWYKDGKMHLLLKPNYLTLSIESSNNGEIYEITKEDIEYFKQFDDIDLDTFIPWTEKKKALAKRL